jgi:hypothetical protein
MHLRVATAGVGCRAALTVSLLCCVPASLFADGLDLGWFVRVPMMEFHSATYITAVILAVVLANYLLNFLVIGLPAVIWGGALVQPVTIGLIVLTILGQVADRVGAVLGLLTAIVVNNLYVIGISNLIYSGLAIFLLPRWFLRRWSVPDPTRWRIALAAGIITNPCWFIFIMPLIASSHTSI